MGKGKGPRGRRGMSAKKEMHHSPMGKVGTFPADGKSKHKHVARKMKHQDPMV